MTRVVSSRITNNPGKHIDGPLFEIRNSGTSGDS